MVLTQSMVDAYLTGGTLRSCAEKFGIERRIFRKMLVGAGFAIKSKANVVAEMNDGPWRDKGLMLDLYERQGKSTLEIAAQFGCDKSVIVDWLNRFGASMRTTAETQKGKTPSTKGKGKRNSNETVFCGCGCGTQIKRFNFGSNEVRFASGHRLKGAAHPLYRPLSPNRKKRHQSADYREWRKRVLSASSYTCSCCGKVGGNLHSHHVAPMAKHPQLMFDAGNGKAMCKPCHVEVHVAAREIF